MHNFPPAVIGLHGPHEKWMGGEVEETKRQKYQTGIK